ncbi:MAG TPA: hypothetical protein VHO66_04580 [Ruminiclostridium sp.]|nr:hypothetical protein [Ruminiclostridium sp.]
MANYSITKKPGRMVLILDGQLDEENAAKFFNDFTNETNKISPSQCTLEINVENLNVVTKDMQDSLKSCFELYHRAGFKKVTMHIMDNAILSMQVNRIASEAGLINFEII